MGFMLGLFGFDCGWVWLIVGGVSLVLIVLLI